jgi:hypothetical protein
MKFWLSRSPFHEFFFFNGISAITEPFSQIFLFHDGTLAITKPFSRIFLFHDGTLAIMKPFSRIFLFHDGILAIKEPFTRTFSFSRWNSGYQGAFHTNFFFLTMELWLSRSLSHELFLSHDGIHKMHDLGEDSFHIYITKGIYIGSASLRTLPLDLEPPLQGKEYGPPYSNASKKRKLLFFPEITYRHVIRLF